MLTYDVVGCTYDIVVQDLRYRIGYIRRSPSSNGDQAVRAEVTARVRLGRQSMTRIMMIAEAAHCSLTVGTVMALPG